MAIVLVVLKGLSTVDNTFIKANSNRKGISDNVPLALCTEEEQQFTKVMNQADKLHPAWLAILSDSFSRLKQMGHLGLLGIGVTFINESVQLLHSLPNCHVCASLVVEIMTSLQVEGNCLEGVLLGIEVLHSVAGIVELTKSRLVLFFVEFRLVIQAL